MLAVILNTDLVVPLTAATVGLAVVAAWLGMDPDASGDHPVERRVASAAIVVVAAAVLVPHLGDPFVTDTSPSNLWYAWIRPLGVPEPEARHPPLMLALQKGVLAVWGALGSPRPWLEAMARLPGVLAFVGGLIALQATLAPRMGTWRAALVGLLLTQHVGLVTKALEVSDHALFHGAALLTAWATLRYVDDPTASRRRGVAASVALTVWTSLFGWLVAAATVVLVVARDRDPRTSLLSWPFLAAGFAVLPVARQLGLAVRRDLAGGEVATHAEATGADALPALAEDAAMLWSSAWDDLPWLWVGLACFGLMHVTLRRPWLGAWVWVNLALSAAAFAAGGALRLEGAYFLHLTPWLTLGLVTLLWGPHRVRWARVIGAGVALSLVWPQVMSMTDHMRIRRQDGEVWREAVRDARDHGVERVILPFQPDVWLLRHTVCDRPFVQPDALHQPWPAGVPQPLCEGAPAWQVWSLPDPALAEQEAGLDALFLGAERPWIVPRSTLQRAPALDARLDDCDEAAGTGRRWFLRCDAPEDTPRR